MARKFHPDRIDRKLASEFKSQIDTVFDGITNAYRVLANKDSRRVYDAKSASGPAQEDAQDAYRKADTKYRQAKTLHSQGRYEEAIAYLEEAIRIRRDKGDYFLLLAMCESKLKAFGKKAEQDLLKVIQLEPWNPEGYVGLAMLYKDAGLQTKAIKQLEKALEAEPEHASAREALADLTGGILEAQKQLASLEGIFAAPEGAATLAALRKLIEMKWVQPDENIVVFNTGSGLKYLDPRGVSAAAPEG